MSTGVSEMLPRRRRSPSMNRRGIFGALAALFAARALPSENAAAVLPIRIELLGQWGGFDFPELPLESMTVGAGGGGVGASGSIPVMVSQPMGFGGGSAGGAIWAWRTGRCLPVDAFAVFMERPSMHPALRLAGSVGPSRCAASMPPDGSIPLAAERMSASQIPDDAA